ncbi:MAG TPA: glycosyltransferase family 2 protein [Chroococcales cyanobacterium]|jgi:cellulose synthase/poly-beta-1,6-N-acetylglucosamine synthase-like glycosyltransferase
MSLLLFLLQSYVLFALLYLFFPLIGAFRARVRCHPPLPPGKGKNCFAVLIPAHDEEIVLPRLLESLEKQLYPFFEIFVVADNCRDKTAKVTKMAKNRKARVFERFTKGPSTKSQALRYLWGKIPDKERFDVVLVLDADNLLPPDFLAAVDEEMGTGAKVVQGMRRPKNPFVSPSSSLDYLSEAISLRIGGEGRREMGLSGTITGSGVAYERRIFEDLLEKSSDSLVEDCEWQLILMLKGEKISFSPRAMVWDEKTDNFRDLTVQRTRWIGGKYRLIPKYFPRFLRAFLAGRWDGLDGMLYLLSIPPRSLFLALSLCFSALALFSVDGIWPIWPPFFLLWPAYFLAGMLMERASLRAYAAILFLPAWVFRILWASLLAFRPRTVWVPTVHRHELSKD